GRCGAVRPRCMPALGVGRGEASGLPGRSGVAGRLDLYLPDAEFRRAQVILESCLREQRVSAGMEERGPEGPVWVCSLCGDAVPVTETVCAACGTSREAVRPAKSQDLQENRPAERAAPEQLQKDEPGSGERLVGSDFELPDIENLNRGDALAARALKASAICVLFSPVVLWGTLLALIPFVILSFWFLGQVLLYKGELS